MTYEDQVRRQLEEAATQCPVEDTIDAAFGVPSAHLGKTGTGRKAARPIISRRRDQLGGERMGRSMLERKTAKTPRRKSK